ncbi:MAG TPA: helix-turn-helix transcriptional regulator [Acidobacteriota bacterium]|jgi:transcriptional regulator with XRE-family HTH domain
MPKSFGERVREIREEKKFTQKQIAQRMKTDVYYISRVENDHTSPTLATMLKLAEALEVGVRDFFPVPQAEFEIIPPRLDKELKKVVLLWKGLTPEHKHLLLRFIEQTHKIDNQRGRSKPGP